MYAAKLGALDLRWSEAILDETTRNLVMTFGFTTVDADVLVERLSLYLPEALIGTKKRDEDRVAEVEMDAKDRHVLAAALSAKADLLLTQNVDHFPRQWMVEHGVELIDAGTLLTRLAAEDPEKLREAHRLGVASRPLTEDEVLEILDRIIGPTAANAVRAVVIGAPEAQSESDSAN